MLFDQLNSICCKCTTLNVHTYNYLKSIKIGKVYYDLSQSYNMDRARDVVIDNKHLVEITMNILKDFDILTFSVWMLMLYLRLRKYVTVIFAINN